MRDTRKQEGAAHRPHSKSDIVIEGDRLVLEFEGKGKQIKRQVRDRLLARALRRLAILKGPRFFSAPDDKGRLGPVAAREVNAFLAEASGTDVTAKDFRTFRASAEAHARARTADSLPCFAEIVGSSWIRH